MEQETLSALNSLSVEQKTHDIDTFRLFMVTWNVASAEPPADITSLLQLNSPVKVDLYVIGLQEVRAAPLKLVSDLAFGDSWSSLFMDTLSPLGYIKVSCMRMQGLLLLVFSKLEHLTFIKEIRTTYTRTGIYGYWGNKGGVSIRLTFYGHSLCFLNCHLAAHIHYASERVEEFEHIISSQTFDGKDTLSVLDHKLVFWFGDLNFRIDDHGLHFIRNCITNKNFNLLWSKDQLIMMKKKIPSLQQFEEGPLDFQPTYKFDVNSDTYDSRVQAAWLGLIGKKRKPAWCDRILWRMNPKPPTGRADEEHNDDSDDGGDEKQEQKQLEEPLDEFPLQVVQETYTSNMEYSISDHKPVIAIFRLELRKMFKTPVVHLHAEGEWSADLDAVVSYNPLENFPSSSWDWIGLYKVGFQSITDYITYTWVKDDQLALNNKLIQVYVSKEEIPVRGGDCVLCYYSSNLQCIVGISEAFKVHESRAAIEEGFLFENVNGFSQALAS